MVVFTLQLTLTIIEINCRLMSFVAEAKSRLRELLASLSFKMKKELGKQKQYYLVEQNTVQRMEYHFN